MLDVDCKIWSIEERKEELLKLVKNFEKEEKYHKSQAYKEATTRGEFIDNFLRILGWDVGNKQGLNRRQKEVIFEDDVRIGGNLKHPDYGLRYNGVTKTFVEAKHPSINLWNNPQPAIQARTYAYMKKLPIAILTDFEELVIYDTSKKPKPTDKAEIGRIKYLNYKEYVENFEELFNTISWFAVKEGKFDEYYKTVCEKKGNLSIDEDILQMIEKWRVFLAEDIALHNEEIDEYNLTGFVQKIIDRIIFLRICEDKDIEEYKTLKNISDSKSDIYEKLKIIFEAANKKFNSGLFKTDEYIDKLKIQDKTLCSIIDSLYLPNCLYDFSIIPVEILGSIYERFLGKIIQFTRKTKNGHSIEIIEKPEVQKAGGVYYTPSYIVQYIVEQTIGKKIEGKTPEEVAKMHFVDPACGSGSFLVGAYQYLLDWYLDFYLDNM